MSLQIASRCVKAGSLVLLLFSATGCGRTPTAPEAKIESLHPLVRMIDYTVARVFDNGGVIRPTNDIDRVGIGVVHDLEFIENVVLEPEIIKTNAAFVVLFDTLLTIADTALFASVRVRLYLASGETADADTVMLLFKFPYESAEIVLGPSNIAYRGAIVQDIALSNSVMYILHIGDRRLFRRHADQAESEFYALIQEADFLAGDSCYLFIDNGTHLARFNTETDSFDLVLKEVPPPYLNGIAAENEKVYALNPHGRLEVLDYEGTSIDSMAVPGLAFHIAIDSGVIFSNSYVNATIGRYDTRARAELPSLKAPARNLEGMEIYRGFLYYGDYDRRSVLRIPIADFVETNDAGLATTTHAQIGTAKN